MASMPVGSKVVINGLVARADLNSLSGTVIGARKGEDRYPVRVATANGIEEEVLVRCRNLAVISTFSDSEVTGDQLAWLSSLVRPKEACVFKDFADFVGEQGQTARSLMIGGRAPVKKLVSGLQSILRTLFDDRVTVALKGGLSKGTQTAQSDVDLVVTTPGRQVSRADKLALAEKLRTADGFHTKHVKVKRLSISCIYMTTEIDLVFNDTVEYGELPGSLEYRFVNNRAAQNAARMLKVALNQTLAAVKPEQVPSFVLELLVLEAQERRGPPPTNLSDGSMQLFLDALQMLVDSAPGSSLAHWFDLAAAEPDGRLQAKLAPLDRVPIRRHASALLHLFCVSRLYSPEQQGFASTADLERWVRLVSQDALDTPLGTAPSWIFGFVNDQKERIHSFFYREMSSAALPGPAKRCLTLEECEETIQMLHAAPHFLSGPHGINNRLHSVLHALTDFYLPAQASTPRPALENRDARHGSRKA